MTTCGTFSSILQPHPAASCTRQLDFAALLKVYCDLSSSAVKNKIEGCYKVTLLSI